MQTVTVSSNTQTDLTGADITGAVRIQNQSHIAVDIVATSGATAPANTHGSIRLMPQETISVSLAELGDLFPSVSSPVRVWAYAVDGATMSVSYS